MRSGRAGSARTSSEFHIESEAAPAVRRLQDADYLVVVITNQPDVARGLVTAEEIDQQNVLLRETLSVDHVHMCPHDESDSCDCRKPRPGLLLNAAKDLDLDLEASWMIGDRWVDLAAAKSAGVAPVLLQRPWSWDTTSAGAAPNDLRQTPHAESLGSCVELILTSDGGP
jgi:D-glycero-D-manno-heptose 1,7-bisphosphate phosphatase